MSEEEKEAMEILKACNIRFDEINTYEVLKKLIEKQQTRIDELEKALVEEDLKHRDKINKAIDKLKEDIKNNIKKTGSYVRDEATVEQERAIAKFEEANEILKILEE